MEDLQNLILEAKKGNKQAFGEIYKLFFKKIYRYCTVNLRDDAAAQDICQETFVKAWNSIKKFDAKKENWSIQAFLFTIARNLIIDRSRKHKELSIENYEFLEAKIDLYDEFEQKQNVKKVRSALSKLEEVERQIIILRFFEDMDFKTVSKILGIKDGALRVRQLRIMQKLKIIFENEYGKRN